MEKKVFTFSGEMKKRPEGRKKPGRSKAKSNENDTPVPAFQ
jgi:hypothetical protein